MKHRIKSNHRWGGSDNQSTIGLMEIFSSESIFRCIYIHTIPSPPPHLPHALAVSSVCSQNLKSPTRNKPFQGTIILRRGTQSVIATLVPYIFTPQVRVDVAMTAKAGDPKASSRIHWNKQIVANIHSENQWRRFPIIQRKAMRIAAFIVDNHECF